MLQIITRTMTRPRTKPTGGRGDLRPLSEPKKCKCIFVLPPAWLISVTELRLAGARASRHYITWFLWSESD